MGEEFYVPPNPTETRIELDKARALTPAMARKKQKLTMADKIDEFGIDPIAILSEIVKNSKSERTKVDIAKTLLAYIHPTLKAVQVSEISGTDQGSAVKDAIMEINNTSDPFQYKETLDEE